MTSDAQVAGPGYHWVLDLPADPVILTGDQYRLHQVLANLLSNARTHTPPGTTITVHVTPVPAASASARAGAGVGVELSVTDDGPGIPAELREHIWDPVRQGLTARSRTAGSTGLGLAIVRAVVIAHQGRISVDRQPGKTTFLIWLPADRAAA